MNTDEAIQLTMEECRGRMVAKARNNAAEDNKTDGLL